MGCGSSSENENNSKISEKVEKKEIEKEQVPLKINTSKVKEDEIKNIKINKDNDFEIIFKLDFKNNDEKKESIEGKEKEEKISLEIYKVYEISDKRIAIETEHYLKIYSITNFRLITEIETEHNYKSIEFKYLFTRIHYHTINKHDDKNHIGKRFPYY